MAIDSAEVNLEWDASKRVLVAPFKIISGENRITLLAHLEPPNGNVTDWQLGLSGGTVLLAGNDNEPPVIFNRVSIGVRFDTAKKRVILTQADFSNGEIGVAGTGTRRLFGRTSPDAGICRHADVGIGAQAGLAVAGRCGCSAVGGRPGRTRRDPAHRGRGQLSGSKPLAKRAADPRRRPQRQHRRQRRDAAAGGWLAVDSRRRSESAYHRPNRLRHHRPGRGRHAVRPQAQCFRCGIRSAGHVSETGTSQGEIPDRRSGAGGRRDSLLGQVERSCRRP